MHTYLFIVYVLYSVQSTHSDHHQLLQFNSVRMLNDVLHNEGIPIDVYLRVCWPPALIAQTYRSFVHPITILDNSDRIALPHLYDSTLIVVDMDCAGTSDWMSQLKAVDLGHPNRWMLIFSSNRADIDWNHIPAWLDSHISVATWNSTSKLFNLEQVYKIPKDFYNQTIVEPIGYWHADAKPRLTDLRPTRILSRRRRNLQNSPLQASFVVVNNDSINHLSDNVDPHIDTVTKTNFMVITALMEALNVTARFRFVNTWGVRDPHTRLFTGMMGDLQTGVSVLAGSTVFLTVDRVPLFEYSSMINPTQIRFVFRAPPLTHVTNIYSLPFAGSVWMYGVALVLVACAVIWTTLRWAMHGEPVDDVNGQQQTVVRVSDVVLLGVGTIAQMGTEVESRAVSTKIALITFLVFLLFMFISYTANIVSLLQSTTKGIRTLDDLYRSRLEFGVDDTPYNRYWMPNSVGRVQQALFAESIANQPAKWMNVSVGVARMRGGMYAFHAELGPAYREIEETFFEHEKCGLVVIDYLSMVAPWMAIPKRSPFKEAVRINLFKIREHGIQSREIDKMYKKKPICMDGGQSFQPVRFVDCHILVMFLVIGSAVAVLVFVLEMILNCRLPCAGSSRCV